MCLFSQNKNIIIENLSKMHMRKPLECVFYKELKSVHHLFFECVVAKAIQNAFTAFFGIIASHYTPMANL